MIKRLDAWLAAYIANKTKDLEIWRLNQMILEMQMKEIRLEMANDSLRDEIGNLKKFIKNELKNSSPVQNKKAPSFIQGP